MNRILLVARREFVTNIRRRSFLFTAFGLPLIILAAQFAIGFFVEQQSTTTGTLGDIGYVDLTRDHILAPAAGKPAEFKAFSDQEAAKSALLDGAIGAYFVVPTDYVEQGTIHAYAVQDVPRGIEGQMTSFLTDNLLVGWPPEQAMRLKDPGNWTISTLDGEKEITEESSVAMILVPFVFALLFMMSIFTTSGFLMQGVVEEKENRLVEILMTSITPLQMLWGKILGLGALGLVQIAVWTSAGGLAVSQGASLWSGLEDISIPTSLVVAGPVYLVLGYLLFGALLAGIGASVTSMQEGQQVASIASLIAVIPMMLSITFFENANGPLPTAMSLIPFTATIAMVMRLPFADVPVWQIALSILLLTLTTLLTVWIAARVFRIGLLMYGKRLDSRSLWIALRQSLDRNPASEKDPVR